MRRQYIPFSEVKKQPALIVDSLHPNGLVLSHWRGAPTPEGIRGDTSADIVLNALRSGTLTLEHTAVTANHFDIDGFVGVWALLHPELALTHEAVLRQMALIGDFRELQLNHPAADLALQLVCWINAKEKELFYPPFGAGDLTENEVVASVPKFNYFLREFGAVLRQPETQRAVWKPEYETVHIDYNKIHSNQTAVEAFPEIGLIRINTPEPVHYYALFSGTTGFDMVLTQYANNRYELEYKYTTWVDLASRPTLPRLSLAPLTKILNLEEQSGRKWTAEAITDTGPVLRLAGKALSRAERYANPSERPIYASNLSPAQLGALVVNYYRAAYQAVKPQKYWSWEQLKTWNKEQAAANDVP
jgi:hypothetical protein